MKNFFTFLFIICATFAIQAQDGTHVLQHISPEAATATPNFWGQFSQGAPLWGYWAGHNAFGDEEFGEKYEIDGHGDVVGIIAYLGGTANSNAQVQLRVWSVAPSGLPGSMLGALPINVNEITADGTTPTMVTFQNDIHVDDEFFVTLDLGDYSHDPHSDTLVLMMGPDGSRPTSDDVFGRNVIRWHGHGSPNWKDFATQNFTPIFTHFAIYPIMDGPATLSANNGFISDANLSLFPVPFADELNLRFNAIESREMTVRVFNIEGKLLESKRVMVTQGDNLIQMNMSTYPAGSYVVAMEAESFRFARVVTK